MLEKPVISVSSLKPINNKFLQYINYYNYNVTKFNIEKNYNQVK